MFLVYLQIREKFKKKMNIVFPSPIKNNSARKSSHVNASEVGDVRAVELHSCAELESKLHLRRIFQSDLSSLKITTCWLPGKC